ncbi:alpha/beta hydrolase [Desulfobacter hydrogenophilus]|uniref:Alpha/beta hydrolase n=1 Tax=Desulfobacter hydrogenophilus TaxID=2291 RepID=A0A328F6L4_9BACT|nr:alpha/beta hydrolase [Desulfobacter hydrogenophilus]NDY74293.1 alpha/beta hydrolase [Desulfobacter hydrogenophilus]QBH12309.1 alpha/beta hydrolase [Desulfobacter hydrogenophilus]RAM00138.1 alpha/beta hydrolase [Desulfobacter hydrogenophilus]
MKTYLICFCILLLALLFWYGYVLLKPMPGAFVRYLAWTITPAATVLRGSTNTGDATIHYVSYGSGPAVLLLHGGLSNRLIWFSQIPWLVAAGRQVVLPDTRGHGDSGLGSQELNYRLLASDAIHVLDKLNIQQADIIGWSDGGNTALQMGHYWPQRVKKMVVISANFNPLGLIPDALGETHTQSSGLEYWFKSWWTGAGRRLAILEKRIKRMWLTRPMITPVELKGIVLPTLVIIGEHDIISIGHAKQMAELLPHGVLEVIPGGHSTPVTHSVQLNEAIANFFGIHGPAQ